MVRGLSETPKRLQCKYFYDERGSRLFDEICKLDEYYLTRVESAIMDKYIEEMSYQLGDNVILVEFGSGSSTKTRILLDAMKSPVAYVPIDISEDHLLKTAKDLRATYPGMRVLPVVADFTKPFRLPDFQFDYSHAALFFPGSTIGNFTISQAIELLSRMGKLLGPNGGMMIGIDLQKDHTVLEAAYNDSLGVTSEFNLNVLHRINNELGGDFSIDQFAHKAVYDVEHQRIEIFVVSLAEQEFTLGEHRFNFAKGEHVLTEYSHKYTIEGFTELADKAGFNRHKYWTDDNQKFAIMHLVRKP